MEQDTIATRGGLVSLHTVPNTANGTEIDLAVLAERKGIEILPHDTETIFVGFSATTCERPIKPTGFPVQWPLGANIKLFWRTSAVAAIVDHPVTQLA